MLKLKFGIGIPMAKINRRQRRRVSGSILIFIGASSFLLAGALLVAGVQTATRPIGLIFVALAGAFLALVGFSFFRTVDENERQFGAAVQNVKRIFGRIFAWFHARMHPTQRR